MNLSLFLLSTEPDVFIYPKVYLGNDQSGTLYQEAVFPSARSPSGDSMLNAMVAVVDTTTNVIVYQKKETIDTRLLPVNLPNIPGRFLSFDRVFRFELYDLDSRMKLAQSNSKLSGQCLISVVCSLKLI